jgi:NADH-quinone oxidoreductase subunit J
MARSPVRTALVAFLLLLCVSLAINRVGRSDGPAHAPTRLGVDELTGGDRTLATVLERAISPTARMPATDSELAAQGVSPPHVAGLGGTLYTDHLITVEVAGAILFVAMVGAALIALPRPFARRDGEGSTTVAR